MSGVYYNLTLAVLLVILALAAYVDRVYSEMGKFWRAGIRTTSMPGRAQWSRTVVGAGVDCAVSVGAAAAYAGGDCADCRVAPVRACKGATVAGARADG